MCKYLNLAAILIALGCTNNDTGNKGDVSAIPTDNRKNAPVPRGPWLAKFNHNTQSRDDWTASVWTNGLSSVCMPFDVGVRVAKDGNAIVRPPELEVRLRFALKQRARKENDVPREALL